MRFFITMLGCFVLLLALSRSTRATDELIGSDTLPVLLERSAWVVHCSGGDPVALRERNPELGACETPKGLVYAVKVDKVAFTNQSLLKKVGPIAAQLQLDLKSLDKLPEQILVVVPGPKSNVRPEHFKDTLAFLSLPVTPKQWGLSPKQEMPLFVLMGGQHGLIPSSNLGRTRAAWDLIGLTHKGNTASDKLAWAKRWIVEEDVYLQRCAIFQASALARENGQAFEMLVTTLRSPQVGVSNRLVTIQALQGIGAPAALEHLKDVAEKGSEPPLREAAIEGIGSIPGGDKILMEWSRSDDPFLAPKAKEVLKHYQSKEQPSPEELQKTIDRVQKVLKHPSERVATKLSAIRDLKQCHTLAAARILADFALDESQPPLLRSAAILGIAEMRTKDSQVLLKSLSDALTPPDLRDVAAALSRE